MSKELLNVCYKFFNKTIAKDELIKRINDINDMPQNEKEGIIKDIKDKDNWEDVVVSINENQYFSKSMDSLTDYEFLEFIAQYIKAPFPPSLSKKEFDKLVNAGIEHDEREWLWRLAFNYEDKDMNFDAIVNYFIRVKDAYYLQEIICAIGDVLDVESIIKRINDKELIEQLLERKNVLSNYITEAQFKELENKTI